MGIRHKIIGLRLIYVLFFLAIGLAFFIVTPVLAATDSAGPPDLGHDPSTDATGLPRAFDVSPGSPLNATAVQGVGFNTSATFQTIISTVITMVLSLMGVIFLILAIYSGFKWMTAGGNEEAVEKAKKTMVNAVIGLVVVLVSYVLARFIVELFGRLVFTMQS